MLPGQEEGATPLEPEQPVAGAEVPVGEIQLAGVDLREQLQGEAAFLGVAVGAEDNVVEEPRLGVEHGHGQAG